MLIDVGDPLRNLMLNACFYAICALAAIAVIPWKTAGAVRLSELLRWLAVPVLALAAVYESAMPARFDIRIDLLVLLPACGLVVATSVARWIAWRRRNEAKRSS
jgi:hypothetical protein